MRELFLKKELDVAMAAVKAAARLCSVVQREMVGRDTMSKADRTPVTVADFGSQAIVVKILKEAFPNDPIVAEEDASALERESTRGLLDRVSFFVSKVLPGAEPERVREWVGSVKKEAAGRHWCLDPIDGTKGFLRRDQYAIALALIVEGEVRLGVLACPNLPWRLDQPHGMRGVIFHAIEGHGAFQATLDGGEMEPIRVSCARMGDPEVKMCESLEPSHSDRESQERLARAMGIKEPPVRMDGQAKYGLVARGDAALYLRLPNPNTPDYKEKVWDHAAGSILVREAGGKVTDIEGKPLLFGLGETLRNNTGVVATNGLIHETVIEAISKGTCGP